MSVADVDLTTGDVAYFRPSRESRAVPEYQPETDRRPMINGITLTLSGSDGAAGTSKLPSTAKPSTSAAS